MQAPMTARRLTNCHCHRQARSRSRRHEAMANPWAGEVALIMDGERRVLKLTLGALAELEATLGSESLIDLVERFENAEFSTRDVLALVTAGLRGGGWTGQGSDLLSADIEGGPVQAARVAAEMLARAFTLPDET